MKLPKPGEHEYQIYPPVEGRMSCKEPNVPKQLIYIGTPYWHKDEEVREARFKNATMVAAYLTKANYAVFSPVTHAHAMHKMYGPITQRGWEFWRHVDLPVLECAGLLIVLTMTGWQDSVGLNGEMKRAAELNIPQLYIRLHEMHDVASIVEHFDFEGRLLINHHG